VTVPVAALRVVDKVNVLEPVAGFGLKDAVVPLCMPEAESVTFPAKPLLGVMVMTTAPLLARPILRLAGVADKLKFGAPTTVRESVVELLTLPLTPWMVTAKVPMAALVLAVKVKVLVLEVLAGLNDAVTPPGRPEAERLTAPLKPFCGVMVIAVPPLLPCTTFTVPGAAESAKSCAGAVAGQLLTRLAALTLPMPVAKSQPFDVA